jgi:hypothetical protein
LPLISFCLEGVKEKKEAVQFLPMLIPMNCWKMSSDLDKYDVDKDEGHTDYFMFVVPFVRVQKL